MEIITHSEEETLAIGKEYGKSLKGGETIGLAGNLGAGKTVFIKGLTLGLGVKRNITSPTFVVMNVYPLKGKIRTLAHIDAYRLRGGKDLKAIGVEDYLDDREAVTVIEWANKVKSILPKNTKLIKIEILPDGKRKISFS